MANDIQSLAKQLLGNDAIAEIGKKVGLSAVDTKGVLASVLPDLLNGASNQASSASTKDSFLSALLDHSKNDASNLSSFFGKADLDDGQKIINHLLGKDGAESVSKKAAKNSGLKAADVAKILACAAPLLMCLMGKQSKKEDKKEEGISLDSITSLLGSSNISSLASSLLGNGKNGKKDDGFGLDDVASLLGNVLKK